MAENLLLFFLDKELLDQPVGNMVELFKNFDKEKLK